MEKTNSFPTPLDTKEVHQKYRALVHRFMAIRLRVVMLCGSVLYMGYSFIDRYIYPAYQYIFLPMRLVVCVTFMTCYFLSRTSFFREKITWLTNIAGIVSLSGILLIIYTADGAASHYYEGINLIILAMLIINSFYDWHHILVGIYLLSVYALACLHHPEHWNTIQFFYAEYMMGSTMFFVVLMTRFYSKQHSSTFLKNEELRLSQKQLAHLYHRANEMSKIDDLTKIWNRRYFFEVLTDKIRQCKEDKSFFYLVLCDVDHFKHINDTFGHGFGDQVIATLAQTANKHLRPHSYIGRYGGDEFMILINSAEKEAFLARMASLQQALKEMKLSHQGKEVPISISFGALRVDPEKLKHKNQDVEQILSLADQALMELKRTDRRGDINLIL